MSDQPTRFNLLHLLVITILLFLLWLGFIPILNLAIPYLKHVVPDLWQPHGTIGDTYGAFNALIGGFGFAAVAITLLLQKKALDIQLIEIRRNEDARRRDDKIKADEMAKLEAERNRRMSVERETAKLNYLQTMIQIQENVVRRFKEDNTPILNLRVLDQKSSAQQRAALATLKTIEDEFIKLKEEAENCYRNLQSEDKHA
jgi:hypothetical protein